MAYPYSQLLHVLSARASRDHGLGDQQSELQLAAIYSADRSILKTMMGQPAVDSEASMVVKSSSNLRETQPMSAQQDSQAPTLTGSIESQDDLADQVIKDVNELYKTRHTFEMRFIDNPSGILKPVAEEHAKSKRERIIELSKALNTQQMTTGEEEEPKQTKRKREERKDIIQELVHTKSEIQPSNEKQKEQLEIIEHFIKAQPSISSAKDKPPHIQEGDLSTIKTGEFGDNIVSETLVELLLKQGKKDKAMEVLKKLIWKFPQKKAYFAAQIEELKK